MAGGFSNEMAGDSTQAEAQARQSDAAFHEWYVVTGGGASAFRMTPGLTVGESESGTLTLNDREAVHQWIEFVLADDGEPWATIVTRDRSLRVDGATCLRYPLGVGATVQLPNNTLHISRDISMPVLSGTVVEVVHRHIPERVQDLVGPGLEEALSAVREPESAAPDVASDAPDDPAEPAFDGAAADATSARELPDDWSDRPLTVPEPRSRGAPRPRSSSRQSPVTLMTGVLALGAVTMASVALWLFSPDKPRRLADFERIASDRVASDRVAYDRVAHDQAALDAVPLEAPAAGTASPAPQADPTGGSAKAVPLAAAETVPVADGGPAPAPSGSATALDSPPSPTTDPAQTLAQPLAEVVVPPVERRSVPRVSQNADTAEPVETAAALAPEEITRPAETAPPGPDPALLAELDETALILEATSTELGRRRDLQAANLALAEGRLTMPPDSNAYRLYNRVLAVDPGSPEAMEGLQAVRQALINRALAQLAGDELEAARRTLQSAADTGADADLVTNLLAEVDYRESLVGGQARRSEASGDPSR